jgi:putative hydrolase of the HAD superfamily
MQIKVNSDTHFIFDLDDTLYPEIRFLQSGYRAIAKQLAAAINADLYDQMWHLYNSRENVFEWITNQYRDLIPDVTMPWLLQQYREHMPDIALSPAAAAFWQQVVGARIPTGLITDGRSITQRNKLKALGIENYFTDIIISEEFGSEKPDERNYLYFEKKYPGREFYFFGDNTSKDFIVPARLGWRTICLKDTGYHIHKQVLDNEPVPHYIISSFDEIELC